MAFSRALRAKRCLFACLAALLVLLLLLFFFLFSKGKREEAPVYAVYTALIETDRKTAECFRVGDVLTDGRAKGMAGEVLGVTKEPALREDAFGVYRHPTRVTLALRIGAYGERTETGVRIGQLLPRVGETLYLYGRARVEGLCVQVRAL